MQKCGLTGAVGIVALHVALDPVSANGCDSLDEARERQARVTAPSPATRKSVSLDPTSSHVIGRIGPLEGGG